MEFFKEFLERKIRHDATPSSDNPSTKKDEVIWFIPDSKSVWLGYMDLMRRSPYQSSRGNNYIMIAYHYDETVILAKAIKPRQAQAIVVTWEDIHETIKSRNSTKNLHS